MSKQIPGVGFTRRSYPASHAVFPFCVADVGYGWFSGFQFCESVIFCVCVCGTVILNRMFLNCLRVFNALEAFLGFGL